MKIVIIGAGSVGTNLHHALESKGIRAEMIHARPLTAKREEPKAEGGVLRGESEARSADG